MKQKKESKTPRQTSPANVEKAKSLTVSPYVKTSLQNVSNSAYSVTPTPTSEPAMPIEVYYNKMALEDNEQM